MFVPWGTGGFGTDAILPSAYSADGYDTALLKLRSTRVPKHRKAAKCRNADFRSQGVYMRPKAREMKTAIWSRETVMVGL